MKQASIECVVTDGSDSTFKLTPKAVLLYGPDEPFDVILDDLAVNDDIIKPGRAYYILNNASIETASLSRFGRVAILLKAAWRTLWKG